MGEGMYVTVVGWIEREFDDRICNVGSYEGATGKIEDIIPRYCAAW